MYTRWAADNIWLFIPVQKEIEKFLASIEGYPFQEGVTVCGDGVNYRTLRNQAILKQLGERGLAPRPGNYPQGPQTIQPIKLEPVKLWLT